MSFQHLVQDERYRLVEGRASGRVIYVPAGVDAAVEPDERVRAGERESFIPHLEMYRCQYLEV